MKPAKQKESQVPSVLAGRDSLVPTDSAGRELYPNLAECLQPRWENGKCVRQAGRIGLRIVGPYFLVTLSCPTEGVETTATVATIKGLMEALERHIVDPAAVWTPTFDRTKEAKKEEAAIRKELKKQQAKDER